MKSPKKVLITGGAGYIGNELVKALPKSIEIVIVDNFHIDTPHKRAVNKELKKGRRLTLIESNVSEIGKYKRFLKDIDVVVYMASLNSYKESNADPLLYLQENNINLRIFLNVLEQYSPNIKKFILTSTRGIYGEGSYTCSACKKRVSPSLSEKLQCPLCGSTDLSPQKIKEDDMVNPTSHYGITKKLQEDLLTAYCSEKNTLLDIFRIFNVYGEDQGKYYSNIGIIPQIYEQITTKHTIYLSGNGNITRDFIYIGDIVNVLLHSVSSLGKRPNTKEVYNLGSGRPVSINDIAQFFESLGYTFKKNRSKKFGDIRYSVANNAKVSKEFNIQKFTDIYTFLTDLYKRI